MAASIAPLGSMYQGHLNSSVDDYNANVATQNAQIVENQGAEEAQESLVNSRKITGAASAAYGASGVAAGGSAAWVLRASAQQGELSALTLKNNADIKSVAYQNEAALDKFKSVNDIKAGDIGAVTSAINEGTASASAAAKAGG